MQSKTLRVDFGGASGDKVAELRYKACPSTTLRMLREGEVRYTWGTMPTDYQYTGQRSEMESIGLMYYNARWSYPMICILLGIWLMIY